MKELIEKLKAILEAIPIEEASSKEEINKLLTEIEASSSVHESAPSTPVEAPAAAMESETGSEKQPAVAQPLAETSSWMSDLFGTTDPEEIQGIVHAWKLQLETPSEQPMVEEKQPEKDPVQELVEQGILDGKIPEGRKEAFMKLPLKALQKFLETMPPKKVKQDTKKIDESAGEMESGQEIDFNKLFTRF